MWIAATTNPNRDHVAAAFLTRAGHEVLAPLVDTSVVRRGRAVRVLRPLFPRYLLVRLIGMRWYDLLLVPGVAGFVRLGNRPAPVPERVIVELRTRMGPDGIVRLGPQPRPNGGWSCGEPLRVVAGPLIGHDGLYVDHAHGRIRALLQIMGADRAVELPAEAVAKVRDPSATPRPGKRLRRRLRIRKLYPFIDSEESG